MKSLCLAILLAAVAVPALGDDFTDRIPIINRGGSTYYVEGQIDDLDPAHLLVDTGASYSVIDQEMFAALAENGRVEYVRKLRGVMADGSKKVVSIYRIAGINLGGKCYIRDIEVAIFPYRIRPILGLNALRKVSPFAFSLDDNPELMLSNCQRLLASG